MDDTLLKAFNEQIALEQASAQAYRQLAIWAEANDLSGAAAWLRSQADEESEHADVFIEYVIERGEVPTLSALDAPPAEFDSIIDVFEAALAHEKKVTEAIGALYQRVQADGDVRSLPLLTRFLEEQVHEEAAVRTIVDELKLAGGSTPALLMLDRELPGRRKSGAEAV